MLTYSIKVKLTYQYKELPIWTVKNHPELGVALKRLNTVRPKYILSQKAEISLQNGKVELLLQLVIQGLAFLNPSTHH